MATGPQQGAAANPIPIRVAASRFLHWAHSHSLLRADAYFPAGGVEDLPTFDQQPVSLTAISTLRQKQVRFVGVSPAAAEITVFLYRAAPSARALSLLPQQCEGYRLKYRQGNPEPVNPANVAEANVTCAIHMSNGNSFYTCGSSISVGNARAAGTLGCLLRDARGQIFGLSNNHVTGSCNYAPTGLPIVAPGVLDVSPTNPPPFTLGFHRSQLQMMMGDPTIVDATQNQDAATFSVVPNAPVSSMQQSYYDTPATTRPLAPGMTVEKVGRSSERTTGAVLSEIVGATPINYSAPHYGFSGLVYFEPIFLVHGIGDRFSEQGDSGALVTHEDANGVRHAVGIVVAGADDSGAPGGKLSLIMPIQPILTLFGLQLVTSHNV
jgi:hypothetical protein